MSDKVGSAENEADEDTSNHIVASHVVRLVKRNIGELSPLKSVVVLICGYRAKAKVLQDLFLSFGKCSVSAHPAIADKGPDHAACLLDAAGFRPCCAVAFVDYAIRTADVLNSRLRASGNDPLTSALRRDKFQQQEALERAHLPSIPQILTSDAEQALNFCAKFSQVVVKPRDASGGEGVWLCNSEEDVRAAFDRELGKFHHERARNSSLVVMKAAIGEEWIVNTVGLNGIHKVTDVWRGPSKMISGEEGSGPLRFLYDVQYLVTDLSSASKVIEVVLCALKTIGLENGASHTELVVCDGCPYIYEVRRFDNTNQ
eukprot:TRINITY_DN10674_c0_g1_i2.p1 TRINITY_DN10674_c0_g1~~TRINITY_DN10674_c0_g1_i2.p1  ORF type:complete len:315 (-),score=54.15 TRINITY_DN10674_c0_g1_i2:1225-2169(-)